MRAFLAFNSRSRESLSIQFGHLKGWQLPKHHGLENLAMTFGRYESAFMSCLTQQCEGIHVAYDIGANFGYTSLVMANALGSHGRVYAFEPSSHIYKSLLSTIELNSLEQQIVPREIAVSKDRGTASFVTLGGHTQGLLNDATQGQILESHNRIDVSTTTLDHLVYSDQIESPQLLKIDVEGGESLVVQGARRVLTDLRPRILLELHGRRRAKEVWDLMVQHRYVWNCVSAKDSKTESEKELLGKFPSKWTVQHFCLRPKSRI